MFFKNMVLLPWTPQGHGANDNCVFKEQLFDNLDLDEDFYNINPYQPSDLS